jgi:chromosomal replication initiator protein
MDFLRRRLPNLLSVAPPTLTAPAIIAAVAQTHNLRAADLIGSGRAKSLTRPRHIAMYLARTHTALSLPELGREFGNRDHTTILHGVNKMKDERAKDADLDHQIKVIQANLGIR